jgi:predicted metal-dependent HD superfamily phosphohydrolase
MPGSIRELSISLSMYDQNQLAKWWQQSWPDKSRFQPAIDRVFQLLVSAYTQPDRYYHNLDHIQQVLNTLEQFGDRLQDPIAVSLAAWFHDFVYNSQATDNEIQSAKLAGELLLDLGTPRALIDRIQQLILATQGHQIDPDDPDRCIFLDADLAILSVDPVRYQVYARSIRREYSWVSDAAYQVGRIRVLKSFLDRDRLYYTDLLFNELEALARFNIQQEIAVLQQAPLI